MRRAQFIAGAVFFLLGVNAILESTRVPYMARYGPGPGFLPFWLGVAAIVLSSLHMANLAFQPRLATGSQPFPVGQAGLRIVIAFGTMAVAAFLMDLLGAVVALIVMVAALLLIIERMSWRTALVAAVAISLGFYLIFGVALGVPLPRGLLDF